MPKHDVRFDYAIGETVKILAIDMPATVTGLLTDEQGISYRLVWWNDGERYERALYAFEIGPNN